MGNGNRMTFGEGEAKLNDWMNKNAFVAWTYIEQPWNYEEQIISDYSLPLNLQKNTHNKNYPFVSLVRKKSKQIAKELPILNL